MKKLLIVLFILSTGMSFAFGQVLKSEGNGSEEKTKDRTLAIVNNEPIMQSEFDRITDPMIKDYKQRNPDATDDKISKLKQNILDEMVNNKLIIQEAKKEKINVSKRQLDEQIKKIKDQVGSEASFKAELRKENLTQEKFEERISEQLMAEDLTYKEVNSKVTEPTTEEINNLLDTVKKKMAGETIAGYSDQDNEDLDNLTKLISKYLSNKKAQDIYGKWMKELRKKANLKINPLD